MRLAFVASIAICVPWVACVKAPHEIPLAYAEFDKAPDYVWRAYSSPPQDEARQAYWEGYRNWLCPRVIDATGKWKAVGSSTVQRQVACGRYQNERRRAAESRKNETFQEGLAEVELGMSEADVRGLLGRPAEIDQSDDPSDLQARWLYRDASRKRTILRLHFSEGLLENMDN